jgi:hypothetical protein
MGPAISWVRGTIGDRAYSGPASACPMKRSVRFDLAGDGPSKAIGLGGVSAGLPGSERVLVRLCSGRAPLADDGGGAIAVQGHWILPNFPHPFLL